MSKLKVEVTSKWHLLLAVVPMIPILVWLPILAIYAVKQDFTGLQSAINALPLVCLVIVVLTVISVLVAKKLQRK